MSSLFALALLVFAAIVGDVSAIPVDNGLEGDPEVQCGSSDISVVFTTRNPFEGHVYVKGLFAQDGCRESGNPSITLPFESCNVVRERSLEPRGIFVRTTLIIQFHPLFVTKVDRAITFQCFYMEADKTVSQDLEVSPLTTGLQTANVPMPVCRYDILDAPGGTPVKYVLVGEAVYHKWTCDTDTVDTFCMVVHSCTVDDGAGDKVDLLDDQGCAIDKYLLRNLEYPTDLMAGQETHVFKYADRNQLFFQCQIAISIKEPDQECQLPQCPTLARRAGRVRRSANDLIAGTADVSVLIDALNLIADGLNAQLPALPHQPSRGTPTLPGRPPAYPSPATGFCLSPLSAALASTVVLFVFVAACVATMMLFLRRK